jgi:3-deoxy-7-phosphoheptulonate synthase
MNADTLSLAELRAEIDRIDDAMLDLVDRRIAAARAIAAAKGASPHLRLRPRRQGEVIARLQERARHASAEAVRHIWRELMGHCLQTQGATQIVIADGCAPEHEVRDLFGSAAPIRRASRKAAIRIAAEEEAVAILPTGTVAAGLRTVGAVAAGAVAMGRLADEAPQSLAAWTPDAWRSRKAAQMPIYPDAGALADVEQSLGTAEGVVAPAEIASLKAELALVAQGSGFLVQAGDCAESFAGFGPDRVRRDGALLLAMGARIGDDTVHVARAAGQFAKPRSAATESRDGTILPSYRGDAVNGVGFCAAGRTPDPARLLRAHAQSRATAGLLAADAAARAVAGADARVHVSHEALLLNYEQALTRFDPATARWYSASGHMVWIGDRTRGLDGAHVEFARGIANPIGLKCGPDLEADELARLIDRLDPRNEAGRLVLIGRFGAGEIGRRLPALMRRTRGEGRQVVWSIDPMHGNARSAGSRKTRALADIVAETAAFFDIAEAEGVHAGGVHLETTSGDVTECLGVGVGEADLDLRYESLCDPRLNGAQALAVASWIGERRMRLDERAAAAA